MRHHFEKEQELQIVLIIGEDKKQTKDHDKPQYFCDSIVTIDTGLADLALSQGSAQ